MAVTVSGLYVPVWIDILDASQLAVDLSLTTNKVAMFTNTLTPNFSADASFSASPFTSNQVTGTGYTAGGNTISSPTVTDSPTGTLMWDAADPSWSTSTISNARCAVYYADALTTPTAKAAICLQNFGSDFSTVAGTFLIQLASGGIFNIDLTP
jgi:hypothetical protein